MKIRFVEQDCWIGLYWKTEDIIDDLGWFPKLPKRVTTWYLCLVPCFPIIWTTKSK